MAGIRNGTAGAAHPEYYKLRNELALRGGYPGMTHNIGVANGSIVGNSQAPVDEGLALNLTTKLWTNGGKYSPNSDYFAFRSWFYHDSSTKNQTLCRFRIGGSESLNPIDESFNCPKAQMPASLAGVDTSPGSSMKLLGEVDEMFENLPDIVLSGGTNAASLKFSTEAQITKSTSFIPTLSALDIPLNNWDAPASSLSHLSPFDVILGNTNNNEHHVVTSVIANQLVSEIDAIADKRSHERSYIPSLL